jgi:hypothetical protein
MWSAAFGDEAVVFELLLLIRGFVAVEVEELGPVESDTFCAAVGDVVELVGQFDIGRENDVATVARRRRRVANEPQALLDLFLSEFDFAVLLKGLRWN